MANYNLVINSRFSPFSYQELLAPVLQATQAHQALEEAYSDLETQADEIGAKADETRDPVTYARYKAYQDDLNKQADLLARQGLSVGSRRSLFNLKSRYSKDIIPIKNAIDRRRELIDQQRAAMLNDRSMMFDIDYANTSLDYLLQNPDASYTPLSGEDLRKYTAYLAANAAKGVQNDPRYQSILNGQYFQQLKRSGFTTDEILAIIRDSEDAPEELKELVGKVYDAFDLGKYDKAIRDKAMSWIYQGLSEGIGETSYDLVTNRAYMSPADKARLAMERDRLAMEKERQQWAKEEHDIMVNGEKVPEEAGGGRIKVYRDGTVIHTDKAGKSTIISNANSSGSGSGSGKSDDSYPPLRTLDYTSDSFDQPGDSDEFSTDPEEQKLIKFSDLSSKAKRILEEDLKERYGLTVDDVDIYKDTDWFSANHYRVVRKGYKADGETPREGYTQSEDGTIRYTNKGL